MRIDCSLCGVKMLNLKLCLSANMNVRYVLHTQPLGLYNEILVWVSLYPSLSLSILVGLSFSPPTPFATVACYPFTSHSFPLSILSSTSTLSMARGGICNGNGHGNNSGMNPPPLD
jgi:hypothetical protein